MYEFLSETREWIEGTWVKTQFPETLSPVISVQDVCSVGLSENMVVEQWKAPSTNHVSV